MLAPATCPNCQFPLTPSAVACPRCGQPVRPVERLHGDAGGTGVANPAAPWAVSPPAEDGPPPSEPSADISTSSAAPPVSGLATTLPVRARNGGETPLPAEAAGAGEALVSPPAPVVAVDETATLPTTGPEPPAPPPSFVAWGRPVAESPPPAFLVPRDPVDSTSPPAPALPLADEARPPPMIYPPPAIVPTPLASAAPPAPAPAAEVPGVALRPANTATTGALVLLPQEEVVTQLGALYLTSKRVILYAPTILRAAFIRDVDAVGTVTERASGWSLFFALLVLAVAGVLTYLAILQNQLSASLSGLYQFPLWLIVLVLVILGGTLLATYFFWVKKSLFLSVGGRPLIVISLSGWTAKRLEGVDLFVNAFSQIKDAAEYPRD